MVLVTNMITTWMNRHLQSPSRVLQPPSPAAAPLQTRQPPSLPLSVESNVPNASPQLINQQKLFCSRSAGSANVNEYMIVAAAVTTTVESDAGKCSSWNLSKREKRPQQETADKKLENLISSRNTPAAV